MKYRLKCDIPGIGNKGDYFIEDKEMTLIDMYRCVVGIMLALGSIEEVKEDKIELWEEMPPHREKYWYLDCGIILEDLFINYTSDIFRFKSKNMHKTRESAEEALRLIMSQ